MCFNLYTLAATKCELCEAQIHHLGAKFHNHNLMRTLLNTTFPEKHVRIALGWVLAFGWMAIVLLYRLTLRVERKGLSHLASHPNRIYVFWHENLPMYFHTHLRITEPQIWMQHPALFMTPVHTMIQLMGVRHLAFGSSGNDGKHALQQVITGLKSGLSTVITPDGPRGPVKQLKPGALIMAAQTGVPIIPMTFIPSASWTMPTWDKKLWPKPFSRITITYHAPIWVYDSDDTTLAAMLSKALNS
jgi:lysophospholipid acyltransferase (LPLAT)-like uncharacterized protein